MTSASVESSITRQSKAAASPMTSEKRALASPAKTEVSLRSLRPKTFSPGGSSSEISSLSVNAYSTRIPICIRCSTVEIMASRKRTSNGRSNAMISLVRRVNDRPSRRATRRTSALAHASCAISRALICRSSSSKFIVVLLDHEVSSNDARVFELVETLGSRRLFELGERSAQSRFADGIRPERIALRAFLQHRRKVDAAHTKTGGLRGFDEAAPELTCGVRVVDDELCPGRNARRDEQRFAVTRPQHVEIDANVRVAEAPCVKRRFACALNAHEQNCFHVPLSLTPCVRNLANDLDVATTKFT